MASHTKPGTTSTDASDAPSELRIVRDANGNELKDGDTVTVIKDLKIKGSSLVVKVGTKVKNNDMAQTRRSVRPTVPAHPAG